MSLLKYPYTNLHELNLDWLIEQLNKEGLVVSVNGKAGIVTLTAEDIKRTAAGPQTVEYALSTQGNSISEVRTQIGVVPLPTTAQTLTGAIAELKNSINTLTTQINAQLTALDHEVVRFVRATVDIGLMTANSYKSATVDVDIPAGTTGVLSIIPQYTSEGLPIAGAYIEAGAPQGKSRVVVGVRNMTATELENVTATVDVVFKY